MHRLGWLVGRLLVPVVAALATAVGEVMRAYGLVVPANAWNVAAVTRFQTMPAACTAAVAAERENIQMYDGFLALDLPGDVRRVFESNRLASLQNHLPAFERCAS